MVKLCAKCMSKKYGVVIFIILIFLFVHAECYSEQKVIISENSINSENTIYSDNKITEIEKKYIASAISYITLEHEQLSLVVNTMQLANTNETTLEGIRNAIINAQEITTSAYQQYKENTEKMNLSLELTGIDIKIKHSYYLINEAYSENLKFWNDDDAQHILNAKDTMIDGILLEKNIISKISEIMDKVK